MASSSIADLFLAALKKENGAFTPKEIFQSHEEFLERIHYSWYEEALLPLTAMEKELLSTALPQRAKDKLQLQRPSLKGIYRAQLGEILGLFKQTPLPLLKKSPFFSLLSASKEELVEFISLLPLPLLAPQVKKIVDKKRLVGFYSLLSETRRGLLKNSLLTPDLGTLPNFDMSQWQGSAPELDKVLHRFGIQLLAQGVHDEGSSFLFYLSRLLDRGRGKMLLEASKEPLAKDPKALVMNVMKYLSKERRGHEPSTT